MTRTRDSGVDALRVLAISAVVFGHVVATPLTWQWIYPWHVPIFFFLTGYFWRSGRSLRDDLTARVRTLLTPYAFWLLGGLVVLATLNSLSLAGIVRALYGGSGLGGAFGAYWFVTALFWAVLLFRALERSPSWVPWLIATAGSAATYFVPLETLPLSLGHAPVAMLFVLIGAFARRHPIPRWAALLVLVVAAVAVASLPLSRFDMKSLTLGTPVAGVAVAAAFSWGLTGLFERRRIPGASFMASAGIAVVLVHTLPLALLKSYQLPAVVLLLIVLCGSWLVALALRVTPLSLPATGASRLRRLSR